MFRIFRLSQKCSYTQQLIYMPHMKITKLAPLRCWVYKVQNFSSDDFQWSLTFWPLTINQWSLPNLIISCALCKENLTTTYAVELSCTFLSYPVYKRNNIRTHTHIYAHNITTVCFCLPSEKNKTMFKPYKIVYLRNAPSLQQHLTNSVTLCRMREKGRHTQVSCKYTQPL